MAFHATLTPHTYLEIGVHQGHSLSLARAGTRCVGVDPEPDVQVPLVADDVTVIAATSDEAFTSGAVDAALAGSPVDLAFIDGLHLFEQALADFVNVEQRSHPGGVVLVHDCLPIDAVTSARERTTMVWSGDVWKLVCCLARYRPDLTVTTLDVGPTGLGVITRLDPTSTVLAEARDELVARYLPLGFDDLERAGGPDALRVIDGDLDHMVSVALLGPSGSG